MPHTLNRTTRWVLVFLSLCLLLSAAPSIGLEADESCDPCDQDDLMTGPAVPDPAVCTLLLEQAEGSRALLPAPQVSQFPHPPIF